MLCEQDTEQKQNDNAKDRDENGTHEGLGVLRGEVVRTERCVVFRIPGQSRK